MKMDRLHSTGVLHVVVMNVDTAEIVDDCGCFMSEDAVLYYVDKKFANLGPTHTLSRCCDNPKHLGWVMEPVDPNSEYATFFVRTDPIELFTLKENLH